LNWSEWNLLSQKKYPGGERDDFPFMVKVFEQVVEEE
jgi:hypothetical protein